MRPLFNVQSLKNTEQILDDFKLFILSLASEKSAIYYGHRLKEGGSAVCATRDTNFSEVDFYNG